MTAIPQEPLSDTLTDLGWHFGFVATRHSLVQGVIGLALARDSAWSSRGWVGEPALAAGQRRGRVQWPVLFGAE
jgi:hypothetical protein